jgi:S1-C subfamily serine protease
MSGLEHANGHRPDGLLNLLHPGLRTAPGPDREALGYDVDLALGAVLKLHAEVPPDAFTAANLGTEREGSGVVIDDNGVVLTIGYLITEAREVTLTMPDGTHIETPLPIGSAEGIAEDDPVVIASFGGYDHAIAGRVVSKREFAGSWEYMLDEAIFTTPMHPYWGGAALIDGGGRLVGTGSLFTQEPVAGDQTRQGNMFVPIDLLAPIRESMEKTGGAGRQPRPWFGMHTAEDGDRLIVIGVAADGPADQSGLEPGDIVLGVEGVAVKGLPHMYRTIWGAGSAGTVIRFTILRDDDVITVRVESGDRYDILSAPRRH